MTAFSFRMRHVAFIIAAVMVASVLNFGSHLIAPARAGATTATTPTGGLFVAANGRALDTRDGTGGYTTPMAANGWRKVTPPASLGIPAGATALQLQVVAVNPTTTGTVAVRKTGTTSSVVTSLNYAATNTTIYRNTTIVPLAADGSFEVRASTSIDVVIDVAGYFSAGATAAGGFVASTPSTRIADSRSGLGVPQGKVGIGSTVTVDLTNSAAAVPADATAAFVVFQVFNDTTRPSQVDTAAAGQPSTTSRLSFPASSLSSLSATVPLGTGSNAGKISVSVVGGAEIDVLVNVFGYYTGSGATGAAGASFTPSTARYLNAVTIPARGSTTIDVTGSGIPTVEQGLSAAALNFSATSSGNGRVGAWPDGYDDPGTTVVNYQPSVTRTNFATVAVGGGGGIRLYNGGTQAVTVTVDLQGFYVDPTEANEPPADPDAEPTPPAEDPEPTQADWNNLIAGLESQGATTVNGVTTYTTEEFGTVTFHNTPDIVEGQPVGPGAGTNLGGGWDSWRGPYVRFNRTEQGAIASGLAAGLSRAICAIPGVGVPACIVASALISGAGYVIAKYGKCGTKKPNLRVYVWKNQRHRNGCYK